LRKQNREKRRENREKKIERKEEWEIEIYIFGNNVKKQSILD